MGDSVSITTESEKIHINGFAIQHFVFQQTLKWFADENAGRENGYTIPIDVNRYVLFARILIPLSLVYVQHKILPSALIVDCKYSEYKGHASLRLSNLFTPHISSNGPKNIKTEFWPGQNWTKIKGKILGFSFCTYRYKVLASSVFLYLFRNAWVLLLKTLQISEGKAFTDMDYIIAKATSAWKGVIESKNQL